MNNILSNRTKKHGDIIVSENGITISNQKLVANKFNTYFTNVSQNLLKGLGKSNNKYQDYLKIQVHIVSFLKKLLQMNSVS